MSPWSTCTCYHYKTWAGSMTVFSSVLETLPLRWHGHLPKLLQVTCELTSSACFAMCFIVPQTHDYTHSQNNAFTFWQVSSKHLLLGFCLYGKYNLHHLSSSTIHPYRGKNVVIYPYSETSALNSLLGVFSIRISYSITASLFKVPQARILLLAFCPEEPPSILL